MNADEGPYQHIIGLRRFVAIAAFLFAIALYLALFHYEVPAETALFVSVITFVYGFFLSSIFTFLQRKYMDFVQNMADMSASIQTLHDLSLLSNQQRFIATMRESLVRFAISLKELSPRQYSHNQELFDTIVSALKKFRIANKRDEVLYSRMIQIASQLATSRERAELFGDRYLVGESKWLLLLLTGIVSSAILLLSLRSWYLLFFSAILILSLVFIVQLLFNVDRMRYGKMKIRTANIDDLLRSVNR